MDDWTSYLVLGVIGGLWPAAIARRKGRNLWLWWLYGIAFPVISWLHAMFLPAAPRPAGH
ncbi:MAG: hypothetical protein ACE5H8_07735 [Alphaproteobacteria bacterium]